MFQPPVIGLTAGSELSSPPPSPISTGQIDDVPVRPCMRSSKAWNPMPPPAALDVQVELGGVGMASWEEALEPTTRGAIEAYGAVGSCVV